MFLGGVSIVSPLTKEKKFAIVFKSIRLSLDWYDVGLVW